MMHTSFWALLCGFFLALPLVGQNACPGCMVDLPLNLPEDTLYLDAAPTGRVGEPYLGVISFRLPRTTTPVAAIDSTVTPGITIQQITVSGLTNLPPGLDWYLPQAVFPLPNSTDGCLRICGTPLQSGTYLVHVVLTAQVFVFTQTASFRFPIVIEPAQQFTDGFAMTNASACGSALVEFENLIPSFGHPGFSYQWDFGNGNSSLLENPPPQQYSTPGQYPVQYRAVVDTFGFRLHRLRLLGVGCSDLFNGPDLKIRITGPDNEPVFQSPLFNNATLPLEVPVDIPLQPGNYLLEVVDEDAGLFGVMETPCGSLTFNRTLTGELVAGSLRIALDILNRVDTLRSSDTVLIFPQPALPQIMGYPDGGLCSGEQLLLSVNYLDNLQWYRDSVPLLPGDEPVIEVDESGLYMVSHTSDAGCRVFGDAVQVEFFPLPEVPVFVQVQNRLRVFDPESLPPGGRLQWFRDGIPVDGAQDIVYCVAASGHYSLMTTDPLTGCSNTYGLPITFNPASGPCITGMETSSPVASGLRVWPNPTNGLLWIEWQGEPASLGPIRLFNLQGQMIWMREVQAFLPGHSIQISLAGLPSGMYVLQWADSSRLIRFD
jgi:hypothetical protein